jgi:hypothetical protein
MEKPGRGERQPDAFAAETVCFRSTVVRHAGRRAFGLDRK